MRHRKLNAEQVREIRATWKQRPSQAQLGKKFGVNAKTVSKIIRGETYKDIRP